MLKWICGLLLLAMSLALAFGAAVGSAAEPGKTHDDPYPAPPGLLVRGSHGFTIGLEPETAEFHPRLLNVIAWDPSGDVRYVVKAKIGEGRMRANLGRFGRIDLHWVSNGRVRVVRGRCGRRVQKTYFADGSFVGSLRLRGGGGFTTVATHRIPFAPWWFGKHEGCTVSAADFGPKPRFTVEAGGASPLPLRFAGARYAGGSVGYSALEDERLRRVEIIREVHVDGDPGTLKVALDSSTGEVSPPAPFSGSAAFARTEHARGTWLGDLSVEFPDGVTAPLAGGAFEAILHNGEHTESLG
jgi:hypothetical protein